MSAPRLDRCWIDVLRSRHAGGRPCWSLHQTRYASQRAERFLPVCHENGESNRFRRHPRRRNSLRFVKCVRSRSQLPPTRSHQHADCIADDLVANGAKQAPVVRLAIGGGAFHCFVERAHEPTDFVGSDLPALLDILDGCINLSPSTRRRDAASIALTEPFMNPPRRANRKPLRQRHGPPTSA